MTLGNKLKDARKTARITLREAQEATGVSNAYISQIENDKIKTPSPKILRKLCAYYLISCREIFALAGYAETDDNCKEVPRGFGSVFIELDGRLKNIQDLNNLEYGLFLEYMRALRVLNRMK